MLACVGAGEARGLFPPVVGVQPVLGVEEVKLGVARLLHAQLHLHLDATGSAAPHKLGSLCDNLQQEGWRHKQGQECHSAPQLAAVSGNKRFQGGELQQNAPWGCRTTPGW